MTLTELAFLIILVTLPVSYGLVKAISFVYELKAKRVADADKAKANN